MMPERPRKRVWSLAALARFLPGLAALAVFLTWANGSGGYFPHVWYAGGLFLIGVLVVVLLAWPGDLFVDLGLTTTVALFAFAVFTTWSYLSIFWADVPGDAWDGANRTALYLIIFALFAVCRFSGSSVLLLLGAFAVGVCLLGLWTLVGAAGSGDVGSYFKGTRFTDPVGYVNGNAALFLLAFWPALFLASRRDTPALLRSVFLATAGVLLQLAVLPQSRGAGIASALVLLVYLALVPGRVRSFLYLLPVGLAVAAGFTRLLDVGSDAAEPALTAGARSALNVMAVTAIALAGVGLALAALDRRIEIAPRIHRLAGRILAVAATVVIVGGAAIAIPSADVEERAERAWKQFTAEAPPSTSSSYLLSGFQTNRADFWRVALGEFRAHPLLGIGVENYGVAYVRERRSDEETLYPHSFPLQVLAQTGLVGAALMVVFFMCALAAALGAVRRRRDIACGASAVGVVMFASWFVHGSIDWFWELPALTGPAFAALALAASTGRPLPRGSSRATRLFTAGGVVLALSVAASFVFPWLSVRETRAAISVWRVDPERAEAGLARARRLNPLADRPDLAAGSIARRMRDWDRMAAAYERALERNPHNWYAHLQLALARSQQGHRKGALKAIEKAQLLNPSEPVLNLVSGLLRRDRPVNIGAISRIFLQRHNRVTR